MTERISTSGRMAAASPGRGDDCAADPARLDALGGRGGRPALPHLGTAILGRGGAEVVPVTPFWRHPDGSGGLARYGGFGEALRWAARLAADHGAVRPDR